MKHLTKERKQNSVEKWEGIEWHIIYSIKKNYVYHYWRECGFCRADALTFQGKINGKQCKSCSLCKLISINTRICHHDGRRFGHKNIAFQCLEEANKQNWKKALKYCRIVLKAIRETKIDEE